jgi:hypothetical protein
MLLILSISLGVCTQVFLYSQKTADYSRDLSNATIIAQSAAASYKAAAGSLSRAAAYLSANYDRGEVACYYDDNWQPVDAERGMYRLNMHKVNQIAKIVVIKLPDQSEIFSLEVKAVEYE